MEVENLCTEDFNKFLKEIPCDCRKMKLVSDGEDETFLNNLLPAAGLSNNE